MNIPITQKESEYLISLEARVKQAVRDFGIALEAIKRAHDVEIPEGAEFRQVLPQMLVFDPPESPDESDS